MKGLLVAPLIVIAFSEFDHVEGKKLMRRQDTKVESLGIYLKGPTIENDWIPHFLSHSTNYNFTRAKSVAEADVVVLELENGVDIENSSISKSAIKILISGENHNWKGSEQSHYLKKADLVAGLMPYHHPHYVRFPFTFLIFFDAQTCFFREEYNQYIYDHRKPLETAERWMQRSRNVTFFANHLPYPRIEMVELASEYFGRVDCGGKSLHNIEWKAGGNKHELLIDSKFNICPENGPGAGYTTEKVYDALVCGSVPLYWAGEGVFPETRLFNPARIILYGERSKKSIHHQFDMLLLNDTARHQFFSQPVLLPDAEAFASNTCLRFSKKVENLLKNRYLKVPSKRSNCNATLTNMKSQDMQDWIVYVDFFQQHCYGVFVEVGGADGISNSNSYAYEIDLNWSGMLIEASPSAFKLLSSRNERRNSKKINGAVGDKEDTVTFIDIEGPQSQLSCVKELATPEHLKRIEIEMKSSGTGKLSEVEIPMKPLSKWLLDANLHHVNFFSLDVEGAELPVLKTIDFDSTSIDVLSIEINGKLEDLRGYLEPRGFLVHKITNLDVIFCHKRFCLQ